MEKKKEICWNCEEIITEVNKKLHYPINATIFCKELKEKKKPYFIPEPYGLPFELTKAGEFRKLEERHKKSKIQEVV
jgi:hypothetical protein